MSKTTISQTLPVREIITGHLTCGECVGLNVENLIKGDVSNCSDEGKLRTSRACPKFQSDPTIMREALEDEAEDGLREIASMVKTFTNRQLKAFSGALLNEVTTRKNGFYMWQPVYVRFRGTSKANYMSNFMTARVLTADSTTVRLVSDDGKVILRYPNTGTDGPSVYSVDAFQPLKEMMIEKGKAVDNTERATPKALRPEEFKDSDFKLNTDGLNGHITSIDRMAKTNKITRRAKADSSIMDLTKIAQSIDNGTANYVKLNEDGEYEMKTTSYRTGKRKPGGKSSGTNEYELADL